MSELEEAIAKASRLPLLDAAFLLWDQRDRIDSEIQRARPETPPAVNLGDPEVFKRVVQSAIAKVRQDYAAASDGPTFTRLKAAHPNAAPEDIRDAIRRAVKLDRDCTRLFSYKYSRHYYSCVEHAVQLARRENPGFQDSTYGRAASSLAWAMR
jgi:hypothetical protein